MRFLHTSDWHLGRQLHGHSLLRDQRHVLDQIIDIAAGREVQAIVIAGDVYDRAIPPAEATALLDAFLTRVRTQLRIPVLLIAGNHDSAQRLGFGSHMLAESGVVIGHDLDALTRPVLLADEHGEVAFHLMPYAEPSAVREHLDSDLQGHEAALRAMLARCPEPPAGGRRVLVGHCFVTGGDASDSERPLSVGGADQVPAGLFEDFDYVALGHLHRPQHCGDQKGVVRYSGSILKYSFSEAGHSKSVSIVELDGDGGCVIDAVVLQPLHDLRILEGAFDALIEAGTALQRADDPRRHDYLQVRLTDTHAILDVMGRLRQVYPNVLHLERIGLVPPLSHPGGRDTERPHTDRGPLRMVGDFWKSVRGDELPPTASEHVEAVLQRLLESRES